MSEDVIGTKPEILVSCATGRGITNTYWQQFMTYELSAQDLSTRPQRLRQWRSEAPAEGRFTARISPDVISHMHDGDRGISSVAEAEIAKAVSRVEALNASLLLLHTPASLRPSQKAEDALQTLCKRLPDHLQLAWRADGLWEESDQYFELCRELNIAPVIDPLMWDEDEALPTGERAYWKIMGGAGLSPKLSEYELDRLFDLADQWLALREEEGSDQAKLWVHFTAPQMWSAARRWRELVLGG